MSIKLEWIEDGGWEGGSLLLFWGGSVADVSSFLAVFESLAARSGVRVVLHELPFIEPSLDLKVIALSGTHTSGVMRHDGCLEWRQSPAEWDNAAGLLELFAKGKDHGGFQFLSRVESAEVIYSIRRSW